MRGCIMVFSACACLAACGNEYHPEYHPVSISEVSQNLAYPVVVHNSGGSMGERGPVIVAQPPGPVFATPPAPPLPAPPLPPAEWFRGY